MTREEALRLGRAVAREVQGGHYVDFSKSAEAIADVIERENNRFNTPDPRSFVTMLRLLSFAQNVIYGRDFPVWFAPKVQKWLTKVDEVMEGAEKFGGRDQWPL